MLSDVDSTVAVGTNIIQLSIVVRDLGVLLDSDLSMKKHVAKVTSACVGCVRRDVSLDQISLPSWFMRSFCRASTIATRVWLVYRSRRSLRFSAFKTPLPALC